MNGDISMNVATIVLFLCTVIIIIFLATFMVNKDEY